MECRSALLAFAILAGYVPMCAQSGAPSPGPGGTNPVNPNADVFRPPNNMRIPDTQHQVTQGVPVSMGLMISGRVVVEGGAPPPSTVLVEAHCQGAQGADSFTDKKGRFSVRVAQQTKYAEAAMDGDTTFRCSIQASLTGYRSAAADVFSAVDRPLLTLRRLGAKDASEVSITDLNVPKHAREVHDRGVEAMRRHDWPVAETELGKALKLYPQYAAAWYELGVVLAQQQRSAEAHDAWNKALEQDNRYLMPWAALAELAAAQSNWQEMARVTDRAVALEVTAPILYFYNAVAYFNLGKMDTAEASARHAVAGDQRHQLPRAEYILGRALAHRNDNAGAAEHMRRYLELSPNAPDAEVVRKQIADAQPH